MGLAAVALTAVSVATAANAVVRLDRYAEIYSVAADGTDRVNLSRNPAADDQPAVSPDGKRIAFVSNRDGYEAIYLMDADGSGQEQVIGRLALTAGYRLGALAWSPTGRRLAFAARQPPVGSFFESVLDHVVDLPSGSVRLVGGVGCAGGEATFSADGRFVAYTVTSCRPARSYVQVAAADRRSGRSVGRGELVGWAPRGNRLLFLRTTRNPNVQRVATVDRSGRNLWVLRGIPVSAAAWSPGGRLIAFVRQAGRRPGIYVVRPGGRQPRLLVRLTGGSSVAWSPDGDWLALTAARAGNQGGATIYVVRASGKGLRRVGGAGPLPVWSRDSRHLAFLGLDGTARVVSPPDPTALRVTDAFVDAVRQVAWGTGDRLLFVATRPGPRSAQLPARQPVQP